MIILPFTKEPVDDVDVMSMVVRGNVTVSLEMPADNHVLIIVVNNGSVETFSSPKVDPVDTAESKTVDG